MTLKNVYPTFTNLLKKIIKNISILHGYKESKDVYRLLSL